MKKERAAELWEVSKGEGLRVSGKIRHRIMLKGVLGWVGIVSLCEALMELRQCHQIKALGKVGS